MRKAHAAISFVLTAVLSLSLLASCSNDATFKREILPEALHTLLIEDGLSASVRLLDHTLAVHAEYPESLSHDGDEIKLGPKFDDAIHKILSAMHRVVLSTDADIRFYVVLLSDPTAPGVYLTIVRYLDDIMRLNVNMLDTDEFISRTIFELNYLGPTGKLTLDQYIQRDIELSEFLSWQLARRIQYALVEEFQEDGLVNIGRCGGEFNNGEFSFTLNVSPTKPGDIEQETLEDVFETATGVIQNVLSGYSFHSYDNVRLIHNPTGKHLILPKNLLQLPSAPR